MREETITFTVSSDQAGRRLDIVLTEAAAARGQTTAPSRSQVGKWIEEGLVSVDGATAGRAGLKVRAGMLIEAQLPVVAPTYLEPDPAVSFDIVYEDLDLIVVDKPPGLVVHPGAGVKGGTLVQGLVFHLGGRLEPIGDALRPGIVHRLDKDTSGLMVVAKHEQSYRKLIKQFAPPREMSRTYLALTVGLPQVGVSIVDPPSGTIELPIGRDPRTRVKMAVLPVKGKAARTAWLERRRFAWGHLLELRLETGRTHQIRVHLQAAKAPIIGDKLYGPAERSYPSWIRRAARELGRQALHAHKLSFIHPRTGERVSFSAEPPKDFMRVVELLVQGVP